MKDITLYLKHKRLDKSLTLENVAVKLGLTTCTYANKEKGICKFYIDELKKLCEILDISNDEMLNVFFN